VRQDLRSIDFLPDLVDSATGRDATGRFADFVDSATGRVPLFFFEYDSATGRVAFLGSLFSLTLAADPIGPGEALGLYTGFILDTSEALVRDFIFF
jgi:hypothetical protein